MMPVDLLARSSQLALEENSQAALPYGSVYGYEPLRQWLAQHNDCAADRIIIGNGSMNLIANWAQHYIHPGDYVLVESPTYDRALTILRSLGAQVIGLEQHSDGIGDGGSPVGVPAKCCVVGVSAPLCRGHHC